MGKNKVIESLGNLIGNTIVHKVLIRKTSKPESVEHLEAEEIEYRSQAAKKIKSYNWNESDIKLLKEEIKKKFENKFNSKYNDIDISKENVNELIDEEIEQILKVDKD